MKTKLTAKQFDLSESLKLRAEKEMTGLKRYFDNIVSADLVFSLQKHRHEVELIVKVARATITATAETDDMHKSLLTAVSKAKAQLKKHKATLKLKNPSLVSRTSERLTRPKTNHDEIDD